MKFISYKIALEDDIIKIPLDNPCKGHIALAEISISIFNAKNVYDNAIDITCDQIDSTFDNPNRLLRRIPLNRSEPKDFYQSWAARHLYMETLDSNDKFLTLHIYRTKSGDAVEFTRSTKTGVDEVYLTLAFSDSTDSERWTSYI